MSSIPKRHFNGSTSSLVLSPDDAIEQVLQVTGGDQSDIFEKGRGPLANPVRTLAVWWMVEAAGASNREIAKRLGMSNAAVCRAVRRVRSAGIRKPGSEIVKWSSILSQN